MLHFITWQGCSLLTTPPSRFGHIKVKSTFGPQFLQGLAREKGLIKVDSLTFQKGDYIPAFLSISILTPHKSCMLIPPMRNQAGWTFVCTEDPGNNGSIDIRYGIDPHGDPRVGGCLWPPDRFFLFRTSSNSTVPVARNTKPTLYSRKYTHFF